MFKIGDEVWIIDTHNRDKIIDIVYDRNSRKDVYVLKDSPKKYFEYEELGRIIPFGEMINKKWKEKENDLYEKGVSDERVKWVNKIEEKLNEYKKREGNGCKYCGNDCPYFARCMTLKEFLED